MVRNISRCALFALALFFVPSLADAAATPGPSPSASAATAGAAAAVARPPAEGTIPYAAFTKDAEKQPGLFTLWRKDGRVYMELTEDQFGQEFLQTAAPANGLGGYFVFSGNFFQMEARIVKFVRDGKRVAILWPNTRFIADPNTPLEQAIRASTTDSIEGMASIVSEDKQQKAVVLDISALLGDVANMTDTLNRSISDAHDPLSQYRLDPTRSFFGESKAFPKNVVIEAAQTFTSIKPQIIDTSVDPRSLLMHMKYNFAELPVSDYMPRYADDRVGFWSDPHIDFAHDSKADNRLQYVLRWNLKASDPMQLSPAIKPILWTISNTVPVAYRLALREAILEWNKAFEKIGIMGAMQVQDQPSDPNFDPEDIRYNTVRWLTQANSTFAAVSQIVWNPRTGEIFRGGVGIDDSAARTSKLFYDEFVAGHPADAVAVAQQNAVEGANVAELHGNEAAYSRGMHEQMEFGAIAMAILNGWSSVPEWFTRDFVKAVMLHEVGHDFGLSHNFIGHHAYSLAQIHDKKFTSQYGIASSVMEYAPVNLPANGQKTGGSFSQLVLGPYDYHAIHWGYAPVPGAKTPSDELSTLARWASVGTDPKFTFAGDEDAQWNGHAIDPRVEQFMLSSDPIDWCDDRMTLIHGLIQRIDQRYPRTQQPWEEERSVFSTLLRQYERCATVMSHYIGAEYLSRARRGDPHASVPLTPVPLALEKRAYKILNDRLFSDAAWNFSATTLRRLVYTEYAPFAKIGYSPTPRHDLSVAALASMYQSQALGTMFTTLTLQRLADMPTKARPGETMTLADLFAWTHAAVLSDIGKTHTTTQVHRNLQRNYTHMLSALALNPARGAPYDAQALARHELAELRLTLAQVLRRAGLDLQTRAHYEALQVDVNRALEAKFVLPAA